MACSQKSKYQTNMKSPLWGACFRQFSSLTVKSHQFRHHCSDDTRCNKNLAPIWPSFICAENIGHQRTVPFFSSKTNETTRFPCTSGPDFGLAKKLFGLCTGLATKNSFGPNTYVTFHCRIVHMRSSGLIQKWTDMYFPNPKLCDTQTGHRAFSFSDVQSVFLIYILGLSMSTLAFVVELILGHQRRMQSQSVVHDLANQLSLSAFSSDFWKQE